jgi:hypothetical protein
MTPLVRRLSTFYVALSAFCIGASTGRAQLIAPSFYATTIKVQGEAPGTEFDDWTNSGITVIDMDPLDNPGDVDFANVQVANDDEFVYIRVTTHNATPISLANVYLGFDTDQDKATGFDVLQIGEIGSELGYQTDYPFAQHASSFNLGLSMTGGPIGNGGALIFPSWTEAGAPVGTGYEWAVPLDVTVQFPPVLGGPTLAFQNPSFNFVIYTDQGLADITQVISYTLATPPAGAPGDFNGDDVVDGADFLVWQQGFGAPYDADDLADWKANFGVTPPATATLAAVPEPGSLALLATAGALAAIGWRRRQRD